jgi:hypothetical protein
MRPMLVTDYDASSRGDIGGPTQVLAHPFHRIRFRCCGK